MTHRPQRRLRTKLIAAFLVPTLLALGVGLVVWYLWTRNALEDALGLRLINVAQAVAAQLPGEQVLALGIGDETTRTHRRLQPRLEALRQATGVARLFVVGLDLKARLDTDAAVLPGAPLHRLAEDRVELAQVFKGQAAASVLFEGLDRQLYKTGYAPLRNAQEEVVGAVGADGSALFFDALAGLRHTLLLIALGSVLLVMLTGVWVGRRIARPLARLVDAAQSIGRGHLEHPVPVEGEDEIAALALALEEMRMHLAERDQRMQMMLSGIAHEVRNPLGGIDLFTGLLEEDLAGEEERLSHVRRVRQELGALTRIVNEFLDYARPAPPNFDHVDARLLLEQTADLVARELAEREVSLEIDVPEAISPLRIDPEQLRRALLNLLLNAVHAVSPHTGAVRLSCRCDPGGRGHVIEVQDNGRGIPAEQLAEVFKPFYTTKAKGTGLGLALARKIVETHRGRIEISSEQGRGTLARIVLPG